MLHERVLLVTVLIPVTPHRGRGSRGSVRDHSGHHAGHSALRIHAVSDDLRGLILACNQGKLPGIDLNEITYYVGRETIIPREDVPGMWVWRETLFAFLQRNAERSARSSACRPGRSSRSEPRSRSSGLMYGVRPANRAGCRPRRASAGATQLTSFLLNLFGSSQTY